MQPVVKPLTSTLANRFANECRQAWNGDETCSLSNMRMSCFASEGCSARRSCKGDFDFRSFLKYQTPVVAVDAGEKIFMGCASADPCATSSAFQVLFPHVATEPGAGVVFNLCVNAKHRGGGVARALMSTMHGKYPVVYVLVVLPSPGSAPHVQAEMRERSDRLKSIYGHMGFRVVIEQRGYALMRFSGNHALLKN